MLFEDKKCTTPLLRAKIGDTAFRERPCTVSREVHKKLEKHCYLHVLKYVDLKKYDYILTNEGVQFGDFHALMNALMGKAKRNPDGYLEDLAIKKKVRSSAHKDKAANRAPEMQLEAASGLIHPYSSGWA